MKPVVTDISQGVDELPAAQDKVLSLTALGHKIAWKGSDTIEQILFNLSQRDRLLFFIQVHLSVKEDLGQGGADGLRYAKEVINNYVDSVKFTITGNITKYLVTLKEPPPETTGEEMKAAVNEVFNYQDVIRIVREHLREKKPRESKKTREKAEPVNFTAGQHTINQLFNDRKTKLNLFNQDKVAELINTTGHKKLNDITEYGITLNSLQMRVFMGILKGFSNTNYQGNYQEDKFKKLAEVYDVTRGSAQKLLNEVYANIQKIPVLKITQADLLRLCGYEDGAAANWKDKNEFLEAVKYLGEQQFCFYWERIKKNDKGGVMFNKAGRYEMEEVQVVGTLLYIKKVSDTGGGVLKYYEITPSPVVIDQVNENYGGSYFLTIPSRWEDEVKAITGKKPKRYTSLFLLWLRLQYEKIRSHNAKGVKQAAGRVKKNKNRNKVIKSHTPKPYEIKITWEEVAEVLRMPPSLYQRNRARAAKMIQEAYSYALKIGYLLEVKPDGAGEVLVLNPDYYPTPGEVIPGKK